MARARGALIVSVLTFSITACFGQPNVRNVEVTLDGEPMAFDGPILMVDMVFPMLPAESFLRALGADVTWSDDTLQLDVRFRGATIQMVRDRGWVLVNGERENAPWAVQTLNGVPYVPGPETARRLGFHVNWDREALSLVLTSPEPPVELRHVAATFLDVEGDTLLVRPIGEVALQQVQAARDARFTRGRRDATPSGVAPSDLEPGDLLDLGLDPDGLAQTVRAGYAQALGTVTAVSGNQLTLDTGQTFGVGAGIRAYGSDGGVLHLLGVVGEAAILRLNPSTNEVWGILSQRPGNTQPPASDRPTIAAFVIPRYDGPLAAGETMELTVLGSAGARANVALADTGLTAALPEVQPGVYTTSFTVPNGMEIAGRHLTARLEAGGAQSDAVDSNTPVTVDTAAPSIEEMLPARNATVTAARPTVNARYADRGPAGIDRSRVTMTFDGRDVTADAQVTATQITYRPDELARGVHSVTVEVYDLAGNRATQTWQFTTQAQAAGGILTGQHSAQAPLVPGDELTVTMTVAEAGQGASFDIGDVRRGVPMQRQPDTTTYVGSYTVQQGDRAENVLVTLHFTAADGTVHDAQIPQRLTIRPPAEIPFAITTPAQGARTAERITPAGTAPAGSRVHWLVRYREAFLSGQLAEGTAVAANDGTWQAGNEVNLRVLLIGIADSYSVTARLLGAGDVVVNEQTVNFSVGD